MYPKSSSCLPRQIKSPLLDRLKSVLYTCEHPQVFICEVSLMSLIACTSNCVYQSDGYCGLVRAGSCGAPSAAEPCVKYVPKHGTPHSQSPDTANGSPGKSD